ncbi:ATP-binding protein [Sphingomonas sp. CFBP 8760]|uniref:ATP-binding protein n=1 Tax=Sphingomonas sp. CFBP 8760 TaxID=2775282 RepID=UPI001A92A5F2
MYVFLDATVDHLERQTLRAQVLAVRSAIVVRPGGTVDIAAYDARRPPLAAGMTVMVLDERRVLTDGMVTPAPLAAPRIPRRDDETYFTRRSRQSFYAGLSVPVVVAGRRLWIVAIQNLDHPANVIDDVVRQFLLHGFSVVSPLLLLLLGIDALIVRRALRPVRRASALVRTIDASRPDLRLTDPAIPTEVRPLADAVNSALDRLTTSLRMTRDFTADAAHELRTPITVARVRAAQVEDPALRAALIADLDALASTVGHLLDIAELDSIGQLAMAPVDLSATAQHAVATIAPLAFRQGKTLEMREDGANIVDGQQQFIERALGALLENAVKHTPRGCHVVVDVREAGVISVADDGPGIAPSDQELVFHRFWRRDRTAAANSGLGLAIVQRVALAHGGNVVLMSRPGLTVFTLRFFAT